MADYKRMYALLCAAIDDVLSELPHSLAPAQKLQNALLDAEELFIQTDEPILKQ